MGRCKHQLDRSRRKAWAWLSKDGLSLSFPVLILGEERQDAVGTVMDPALAEVLSWTGSKSTYPPCGRRE